jgi:hypothetical protein
MRMSKRAVAAAIGFIAALFIGGQLQQAAENRELHREMEACVTDYAHATSYADTAKIDKRWVMPVHAVFSTDTAGLTCGVFRGVLPKSANKP